MKNKKKMDANTIWQWRISCVKKYSRATEPFHYCSKIGLDFNVGSKTHKKLDLELVTNGVILEICDFAKMVNKSKRDFIINILENNFHLGLENEQQRISFTAQILHKVKDLLRKPPKDKHEVFHLFDTSQCISNMASTEHKTDSFLVGMDDSGDSEDEDVWCENASSTENIKTEEACRLHADDSDHDDECLRPQSTGELNEDVLLSSFPYCEEIGLDFNTGSKQSLDPGLLTKGVMLELVHFTRLLTSCSPVVLGVLDHNFELDVKSQQGKIAVWSKVLDLLKSRKQLITMFKNEAFSFYTDHCERGSAQLNVGADLYQFMHSDVTERKSKKRARSTISGGVAKRYKREQSGELEESDEVSDSVFDQSYTCHLDSDEVSGSENTENLNRSNSTTSDILRESESVSLSTYTADASFTLPILNLDVNPPFARQPDKGELCADEEKTQIPGNVPKECLIEQEKMEVESKLWKMRANRVKQILFEHKSQDYCASAKSKKFGLEFDVGFGPKQNISVDSLYDAALLGVARFALAMNSSQQEFMMEILEYNFDFSLQNKNQRKTFACEIMNRVRQLKNCEDAVKVSREVFELPGDEDLGSVSPELSSLSRMKVCDVESVCPADSYAEAKEHIEDHYPFCKEIGLNLYINYRQPNKKLEIDKLNNGAMTEVTNFAERLCGTFDQICLDIFRHNFDLDSRSGNFDPAANILARIPIVIEQINLKTYLTCPFKLKHSRLGIMKVEENFQNTPNLNVQSTGCAHVAFTDQKVDTSSDTEQDNELDLQLWKLRANQIQKILSVPHLEHCPLYSYFKCKKLGIEFNVGLGVKQNLDPKFLTNGVMVEIVAFATALHSAFGEFITEILENNFHLDLKNELDRIIFTQENRKKVKSFTVTKKIRLKEMLFELPDLTCIDEFTYPKFKYCPKCNQDRNNKLCQDGSDPGSVLHPHPHAKADTVSAKATCTVQKPAKDPSSASSAIEETLMHNYPRCKESGLSLSMEKDQPKDKLDTHILTRGIMNEVANFARKLCGNKLKIANDVIEHNFNFDMQSQDINPAVQFCRTCRLINKEPTWSSEVFVVQPWSHKDSGYVCKLKNISAMQTRESKGTTKKSEQEKRAVRKSERFSTRCRGPSEEKEINTVSHHTDFSTSQTAEGDHSYMCPLDSDIVTDSENTVHQGHLQNPTSSDVSAHSESSNLDKHLPFLTSSNYSSSLPTVHSNVNSPFEGPPDDREQCGDKDNTQSPKNVQNDCLMEQVENETESNMWKLRARCVKQILFDLNKHYCAFPKSRKLGLEFDVGFGPKQSISVDCLNTYVLLEVARFALAMNSSQQEFMMEILEYNFDFSLQSKNQRKTFACEIMNRMRQLKNCEDAVKVSREAFELPGYASSINSAADEDLGSVSPELGSLSGMKVCDVESVCPADSYAEAKEHIEDHYPFCKEIGLNLYINYRQPNKKLEIDKLNNGAMTEVTNFAERLCGTFEQICFDILRHNFDSDCARKISAQIPGLLEQRKVVNFFRHANIKKKLPKFKLDFQYNPDMDECNADCSQAPITDQNVGPPTDSDQENEYDLWLWKLRANQIQKILSVPHVEHCPFYSYSRCRKIGIDFNVGSRVKHNLDPKFLTNGVMLEIVTFAAELASAHKNFVTEILEYNFHLGLKNELDRIIFGQQTLTKIRSCPAKRSTIERSFELPDLPGMDEFTYPKFIYCPKCFRDRNDKLCQDGSDPGSVLHPHPHAKADTVSAEATCTVQNPAKDSSSASSAIEETLMRTYPCCKEGGLSLCLEKDQPKDKLETHILTRGIVHEVNNFAKKLCGNKHKMVMDIIQHNFNFGIQSQGTHLAELLHGMISGNVGKPAWFNKVFDIPPYRQKDPEDKLKVVSSVQTIGRKDVITKRQLALQTKRESTKRPSVVKPNKPTKKQISVDMYPICNELGLDLDVTSKSADKKKLDLKLLTRDVVTEIYKYAVKKGVGNYVPGDVYDILEYNFDLGSQHYSRWESALSIACKIKTMIKNKSVKMNRNKGHKVFKLPFVFAKKCKSSATSVKKRQDKKRCTSFLEEPVKTAEKSRNLQPVQYHSDVDEMKPWCDDDTKSLTDPGTIMQIPAIPVDPGCDGLKGNIRIKEEECDSYYGSMKPEPNYVIKYPHCEDVKTESNTEYVKYLVSGDPGQSLGYTFLTARQNSESNIKHSEAEAVQCSVLAEPQVSNVYAMFNVCPNADISGKNELDSGIVTYVVPVETAGIHGYSTVVVGQDTESPLIKEEQENVPVESYRYGVVSTTESEMDIKQERDP